MDAPSLPAAQLVDQSGTIITDIACRRCGYNLRGLRQEGRCPECGTPIGLSVRGDLLRFADPDWVEKMARGIRLMLWGLLVTVIASFIGGCITTFGSVPAIMQTVVNTLAGLVGVYGAWLLTSPDPSRIGEDRFVTARKAVRIGLIVWLFYGILGGLVQPAARIASPLQILAGSGMVIFGLIGVIGEFAKFLYIQRIAERIPNPRIAGLARFLRWAFSIGLTVVTVSGAAIVLGLWSTGTFSPMNVGVLTPTTATVSGQVGSAPTTFPVAAPPMGLVAVGLSIACVVGVCMLIFGILVLVLYFRLNAELRRQAELARLTWMAEAVPTPPLPHAST